MLISTNSPSPDAEAALVSLNSSLREASRIIREQAARIAQLEDTLGGFLTSDVLTEQALLKAQVLVPGAIWSDDAVFLDAQTLVLRRQLLTTTSAETLASALLAPLTARIIARAEQLCEGTAQQPRHTLHDATNQVCDELLGSVKIQARSAARSALDRTRVPVQIEPASSHTLAHPLATPNEKAPTR